MIVHILCASMTVLIAFANNTGQSATQANGSVKGIVIDTFGRPISNAIVRIYTDRDEQLVKEVQADELAKFSFLNISPGKFICRIARKSGFKDVKSFDRRIELHPNEELVVDLVALNLPRDWPPLKTAITGTIFGLASTPMEDVRVKLVNPFYDKTLNEKLTDKNGSYVFTVEPQGQYVIQVFYPGFDVATKTVWATGNKYTVDFFLSKIKQ